MSADYLLDRAENEAYNPSPSLVADLAAEVRSLRDEVGKWQSTALLRASDAARAQEERDALRGQIVLDDEGHRRVCGPAIEERDALRAPSSAATGTAGQTCRSERARSAGAAKARPWTSPTSSAVGSP